MSDLGETIKVPAVRFERLLPGPLERVWEHISTPDKLTGWFGEESAIEPREGGRISLMGGHIRGVVTQWKPPRKLAYTWNVFGPGEAESSYPESYLTLTLEPRGEDVALTLLHLPVLERFESQNAMAWHTFIDLLDAAVRGQPPQPRSAYMQKNAALYGVDLANLHR